MGRAAGLATLEPVPALCDSFDVGRLAMSPGEGRRLDLHVGLAPLQMSGERYEAEPAAIPVRLEISRLTGDGHALRLRFEARLTGPCMRCLSAAELVLDVDAREVDQPGGGDEVESPYLVDGILDLRAWAREALALALPTQVVCRPDCPGLCPVCGADLASDPGHAHEREPDPRWAKLRELM
jgi:uncharacterized protein